MIEFLQLWGTLAVAVLALLQPWLIALWKRFLRPLEVDVYEAAKVEVGFSDLGPTIGIQGTLRARHRDAFIRDMSLSVIRQSDQSVHQFGWGMFRSNEFSPGSDPSFTPCSGFLLSESSPIRYNLQFWEFGEQERVQAVLQTVREAWMKEFADAGGFDLLKQPGGDPEDLRGLFGTVYEEFANTQVHVDAYGALGRLLYWEPGEYTLRLQVRTAKPNRTYPTTWQFTLSESDARLLRLNVTTCLLNACGQGGRFNFAHAAYKGEG